MCASVVIELDLELLHVGKVAKYSAEVQCSLGHEHESYLASEV